MDSSSPTSSAAALYPRLRARGAWSGAEPALAASDARAAMLAEINRIARTAQEKGWDGAGADAVTVAAFLTARRFAESLPLGLPSGCVSADPDGCVTFEWRHSPRRMLFVSVRPAFCVDYVGELGVETHRGTTPFFSDFPPTILHLLRRVYGR